MTMPALLATLLAFSAVAAGTTIGWLLSAFATRVLLPCLRIDRLGAPNRALLIAQVRLLPLAAVAILVPAQIQAFRAYEAGGLESAGGLLIVVAVSGVLLSANAVKRALSTWSDTRDVIREWRAVAVPLVMPGWSGPAWTMQAPFPVVAIGGTYRPQLFVAQQVLDDCTGDELSAIAAHERAHAAARDNLIRLLFELTPGARLCRRIAEPLEHAWAAAAEEAADLSAGQSSSPLDLASALAKVARLASGAPAATIPVSALIGGADLSTRVRRLLQDPVPRTRRDARWIPVLALLMAAVVVHLAPVSATIHELFEMLVRQG